MPLHSLNASLKALIARFQNLPWSLGAALGMLVYFAPHPEWHRDLAVFRNAPETLRHPYWARWLFSLLAIPPEPIAYLGLSLACIACLYAAAKVLGGKTWMVFTSFAFAWTLFYGQIDGLVAGGIALAWWALQREDPLLVGAGLTLASIKPQLSLPISIAFWWWSSSRVKVLIVPALVVGFSLVRWGWWIPAWLETIGSTDDLISMSRNISLWPNLGAWTLLIWPAILWAPLDRSRKLIAIAAGTAFSVPYFPLPSLVLLLSMPIPWWFWLIAQIPALGSVLGYGLYYGMRALPPLLLVWACWPALAQIRQLKKPD